MLDFAAEFSFDSSIRDRVLACLLKRCEGELARLSPLAGVDDGSPLSSSCILKVHGSRSGNIMLTLLGVLFSLMVLLIYFLFGVS